MGFYDANNPSSVIARAITRSNPEKLCETPCLLCEPKKLHRDVQKFFFTKKYKENIRVNLRLKKQKKILPLQK